MIRGRFIAVVVVSLLLLSVSACVREEPTLPPLLNEDITDELLYTRITEEAPYRTYGQFKGHEGKRPGQSPHGSTHVVYANAVLLDALPNASNAAAPASALAAAPEGTIIVKENYNTEGELGNLTVMAKVRDFAPETGDWFWAVYGADGSTRAAGNISGCISCHEGMKRNDYIIIQRLSGSN